MAKKGPESGGVVERVVGFVAGKFGLELEPNDAQSKRREVRKLIKEIDTQLISARADFVERFPQEENLKKLENESKAVSHERRQILGPEGGKQGNLSVQDEKLLRKFGQDGLSKSNPERLKQLEIIDDRLNSEMRANELTEEVREKMEIGEAKIENLKRPWRWLIRKDNALRDYNEALVILARAQGESTGQEDVLRELAGVCLDRLSLSELGFEAETALVSMEEQTMLFKAAGDKEAVGTIKRGYDILAARSVIFVEKDEKLREEIELLQAIVGLRKVDDEGNLRPRVRIRPRFG